MSTTMTSPKQETSVVMVYLEPKLKQRFRELCYATDQSMSGVLAAFVKDLVARHVPEAKTNA